MQEPTAEELEQHLAVLEKGPRHLAELIIYHSIEMSPAHLLDAFGDICEERATRAAEGNSRKDEAAILAGEASRSPERSRRTPREVGIRAAERRRSWPGVRPSPWTFRRCPDRHHTGAAMRHG